MKSEAEEVKGQSLRWNWQLSGPVWRRITTRKCCDVTWCYWWLRTWLLDALQGRTRTSRTSSTSGVNGSPGPLTVGHLDWAPIDRCQTAHLVYIHLTISTAFICHSSAILQPFFSHFRMLFIFRGWLAVFQSLVTDALIGSFLTYFSETEAHKYSSRCHRRRCPIARPIAGGRPSFTCRFNQPVHVFAGHLNLKWPLPPLLPGAAFSQLANDAQFAHVCHWVDWSIHLQQIWNEILDVSFPAIVNGLFPLVDSTSVHFIRLLIR